MSAASRPAELPSLSWAEVCARRLTQHALAAPRTDAAAAQIAAAICGAHARDLPIWTGALSAVPGPPNRFADGVQLTAEQADAVIEAIAAGTRASCGPR